MHIVQEGYAYKSMAVSGTVAGVPGVCGGFLCTTGGTLEVLDGGAGGAQIVLPMAVTAGAYYPIPAHFGTDLYATLTGAQGTFFYLT